MKWAIILWCLVLAGCSQNKMQGEIASILLGKRETPTDINLIEIDNTQKQLASDYEKANRAISVNDAEKVYLQRIHEELQYRRERRCNQLKADTQVYVPTCN